MPLDAGQQLLHYRLIEPIGEGGMGVVWKALDTNLDREVAIKVLPEELARDPERIARFEREAKVLATLNHPNIAGIYGFHPTEASGAGFLAMELVEGTPLDRRLQQGPLDVDDALELAGQLAAALEAAHAKGIVHRDLKPGNVVVGPDGNAKVLDFGLAKAMFAEPAGPKDTSLTQSPTVTSAGTLVGTILGTAAYMAPEQARGLAVGHQADLWSFGVVLYETLAGRRPFDGETITDTLASIVQGEPDWRALPATTPRSVRRLLRRCLTKDARRRQFSAADARLELEDARDEPDGEATPAAGAAPRAGRLGLAVAVLAALALGTLAGWSLRRGGEPAAPGPVRRLSIVSDSLSLDGLAQYGRRQVLDISRDGRLVVFVGKDKIYLRRMDQTAVVPVPGTEGADIVSLSPDDQWLGFAEGGRLRKVPLSGGAPVDIAELTGDQDHTISSIAWARDGTLYFGGNYQGYQALYTVPERGGTPEFLVDVNMPNGLRRDLGSPQLIDDDRKLLFTSSPGDKFWHADNSQVVILDLATGEETVVADPGGFALYVPSGHLLVARGDTHFVLQPFDVERLRRTGDPVPLRGDLVGHSGGMMALIAYADDGTMVYEAGARDTEANGLVWFGADGTVAELRDEKRPFRNARIAADGKQAIVEINDDQGRGKLWHLDLGRDSLTLLTTGDHDYLAPVWLPDGRGILYMRSLRGEGARLQRLGLPAGGPAEDVLDPGTIWYVPEHVSPDGRHLAAFIWDPVSDTHWDVEIVSLVDGDDRARTRFAEGPADELYPRFSPDGGWLAYTSDRSGRDEVYIKRFPEQGAAVQVSRDGGRRPLWGPEGDRLYFLGPDNSTLMAVELPVECFGARRAGPAASAGDAARGALRAQECETPRVGMPRQLAELPAELAPAGWLPWGSVGPDGRLLLVRKPQPAAGHINIVVNWFDELRGLAP